MTKNNKVKKIIAALLCGAVLTGSAAALTGCFGGEKTESTDSLPESEVVSEEAATNPDDIVATASIMSTGDILLHSTFLGDSDNDGTVDDVTSSYYYDKSKEDFDFTPMFRYVKDYYQRADYAVVNLEVTLCGDKEIGYGGYPLFNSPDAIVDALKDSGINMCLTATNHVADTEAFGGFDRTQKVVSSRGLQIAGTQHKKGDQKYNIITINGIKIGITNYVYTSYDENDNLCINGMPMSDDMAGRVNHFAYEKLDDLYKELDDVFHSMKQDGAEVFIFYPHWGEEYQLKENDYQDQMAQAVADLGYTAIVGGHTHCVQPTAVVTAKDGRKVPVLYSMGNQVSNQRKELMEELSDGHTEDSLLYYLNFARYGDGTVKLVSTEAIPTWTYMQINDKGQRVYEIIPLDKDKDLSSFNLSGDDLTDAENSYTRTMKLVSSGVEEYNNSVEKKNTSSDTSDTNASSDEVSSDSESSN